ncbi:MAG: hypothetical protein IKP06_01300 [Elusimicrobiaceae bacterium]|nr:hypothetical protein [Elusimicrobiaceae bacterium]
MSKDQTYSAENLTSFSEEFLDKTRQLFQPLAGRDLSDEECAQIARNMIGLEMLLRQLRVKYA